MLELGLSKLDEPPISNSPPPDPNWTWWQKLLGVVRKILNLGNAAGFWPSQRPRL